MRNVKQTARAAFDEFDLRFTQQRRASLGADLANVNRQLRAGAVVKGQLACGAFDQVSQIG